MSINFKYIFKGFAAIVILLLLCFITFYFITLRRANHVPIPNNAVWVIKIDGVNAIKKLWQNALEWNTPTEDSKHSTKGMSMPLHFYIYNTTNCPNAFFTSLLLNDEHLLHANLIKQDQWKLVDSINHLYINESQNIALTFNRQYATIAWNIQEPYVIDQLMAISANTNTTKYADTKYIDILVEDHLISISDLNSHVFLDFEKGYIAIGGKWYGQTIKSLPYSHLDSSEIIINIYNNIAILNKQIIKNLIGNNAFAEIRNRIENSAYCFDLKMYANDDVELISKMVNYEYDDNFNKIEKVEISSSKMPKTNIFWLATPADTFVNNIPQTIDEESFPAFDIYFYPPKNNTILWSNSPSAKYPDWNASVNCLKIEIDLDKVKKHSYFKSISSYLPPFSKVSILGKEEEDYIKIEGRIDFEDQSTNSLQIIRNWWNSR